MRYLDEPGVITLRNELKGYYSKLYSNMKKQQQFYDQEITLPKQLRGIEPHVPPTARTIINTGVDTLMALDHLVTVLLWRDTKLAKQTASRLKMFDKAYLANISKKTRYNVRRMALKHGLLYGEYNVKGPIYMPRLAPEKLDSETPQDFRDRIAAWEDSLDKTFPFTHRIVNPMNVMWDPGVEPVFVIEDFMRPCRELLEMYPEHSGDIPPTGNCRWTAFYTNDHKRYMVNNKTIFEGGNLGGIPYERGNAGFGNEDETASPDKAIVGILAPALKTLRSDITLRTTILYGLQYAVWGKNVMAAAPGTAGAFKPSNIPGETSVISDAYNYRSIAPPQLSPETYRILGMFDQDIQQIMPKTNWGSLPKGMTSGSMFYTSIIQGRQSLTELKSQWEMTASSMCNRLHLLLKYLVQEPVGILGTLASGASGIMKIAPGQLHPDVQATAVTLDPMTPEERDGRINLGVLLLRSGAISRETACENFFGLDWQIEGDRILIEKIMANPAVEQKLGETALEQAGLIEVLDALKQQGFQIQSDQYPQEFQDIRRAQPDMQEMYRPSDYTGKSLGPGTSVYQLPHRAQYGQAPEEGDGFN